MTTAKVGPTQNPNGPRCPEMYGYQFFNVKDADWTGSTMLWEVEDLRNTSMERARQRGYVVRPFTIPAESADDRKEAP